MFGLFGGSQRDIYGDQAGLSGGFGGGRGGDISNTLLMAGLGLMSSPRNNPMEGVLKGVTAGMALDERGGDKAAHKRALYMAYRASGMDHQRAAMLAEAGDSSIGKLLLDQENKAKARKYLDQDQVGGAPDIYGGGTGGGSSAPSSAPRTVPSGPRMLPMPSSPSTSDSPLAPSSHVAPAEPQQSVAGGDPITQYAEAIAAKESGGRYGAVGPTHPKLGRALGKYQVMEANVGPWTQAALGKRMTGDEFLESPEAQDAVFRHRFGGYAEKHGPEGAASMWFTGRPHAPGAKDVLGTTGANYVASFRNNLARLGEGKPQQVASADSSFMPGPLSEEDVGTAPSADPVAETKARTGVDWNNPVARQHMIDAGLTPPGAAAPAPEQPAPEQPAPSPQASLDPETQKIKAQYDAQIKELLGTGQMKKAEQLEAMRDSSMAQRMPPPSAPSPQPAPPIGPQIASADSNFVPASNPAAPQDTSGVSYTEQVQRGTPAAQVAQATTGTMTDAPRMVKTTRERPMGAPPAQAQANPEAGQTPAFIMRRRAILQEAQRQERRAIALEQLGEKSASEIMREKIKFLYDQAKPTDEERRLLAAGVPPGSKQWNDAMLDGGRTAEQRNVRSAYPNDPAAQERAHREQLSKDTPAYRNAKRKLEAMGLREGTPEFNKQLPETLEKFASAEGGQPKVESAYDQRMGGIFADMNKELITEAREAKGKIATLNRLEQLLSDPNVYQGTAGPLVLQAKRLAKSLGFDVEGVEGAEAITAIANRFALEARNPSGGAGMPGALSDKDREFLVDMGPGLGRTPEGNKHIIDYNRRLAMRSLDVERQRQLYLSKNKGRLDEGFYTHLEEWSAKNPVFNDEDRKNVQRLSGGSTPKDSKPAPAEETPPPGYTGSRWKYLTPEERKLWQ
jgi:hypothetical protein